MARSTVCLAVPAAVTIAVALISGGPPAHADDSAASGAASASDDARFPVALLDVGHVFKNHNGFKKKMELMKVELVEIEDRFRLERAQIKVFEDQLKTLTAQSEEYLNAWEKVTNRNSTLQGRMAREKQRFMRQEAAIYAQVYAEIQDAVEDYSRDQGIRLVIRFHSEPIDESDANSVMKGVNRNVVFQDGLNISDDLLQRLNEADDP